MLREWFSLMDTALAAEEISADDNDDIILWERTGDEPPTVK